MTNTLKAKLENGQACLNGWSLLPSHFAIELYAQGGWDCVTIDIQHGLHDYASALLCIQALQPRGVTPLVRVPWNEPGILGKVLDAGAQGIICPMVNNAFDAVALTRACFYPPLGQRSYGTVRGAAYGGSTPYSVRANQDVLILPQIETAEAVANVDEILDTPGIGGIFVGPSDLGLSLGLPAMMDREEPVILEVYEKLLKATLSRGLTPAIYCTAPAYAARMIEMGFRLVTAGADSSMLINGAREAVSAARSS